MFDAIARAYGGKRNCMRCAMCGGRTHIPKGHAEWALCPKCFQSDAVEGTKYEDAEEYFEEANND